MPGIFQTRWSGGDPRISTTGPTIPKHIVPSSPASAWQRVTGDAGWAAVLAESAIDGAEVPTMILCRPGSDMLTMVDEAIRLLPIAQRWMITFDNGPTDRAIDALWKWRVSNAGIAAGPGRGRAIDLTVSAQRAPECSLSHLARTGHANLPDLVSTQAKDSSTEHRTHRRPVTEVYPEQSYRTAPPVVYSGLSSNSPRSGRLWQYYLAGGIVLILFVATVTFILLPNRLNPDAMDNAIAAERVPTSSESIVTVPTAIDRASPEVRAQIQHYVNSIEFGAVAASAKQAYSKIETLTKRPSSSSQRFQGAVSRLTRHRRWFWSWVSTVWLQSRAVLPTAQQCEKLLAALSNAQQQPARPHSPATTQTDNALTWNLALNADRTVRGPKDLATLPLPNLQKLPIPQLKIEMPPATSRMPTTTPSYPNRQLVYVSENRTFWLQLNKVDDKWTLQSNFSEKWASLADSDREAYAKARDIRLQVEVNSVVKYTVTLVVE